MTTAKPGDLEAIVEVFFDQGVEFIVVDGQAEWLMGGKRATLDVDLCYRKSAQNLERLAQALAKMKPTLRNAPPDLPFQLDARSLALGDNFTFHTLYGDLDLLGYLEPIGGYEELIERAERFQYGEHVLVVIALEDPIRIKRHIGRRKDQDSLEQLLAIKRTREESAQD